MDKGTAIIIILAHIITISIFCGAVLKRNKLWPKIAVLCYAIVLLTIAGLIGAYVPKLFHDPSIDAKIISVQPIDDDDNYHDNYKVECEYTYKNKTYRAFAEKHFDREPEVGSTVRIIVTDKSDEIYFQGGACFDGLLFLSLLFGIALFGIVGIRILIKSIISIDRFCKSKKTPPKNYYSDETFSPSQP